MCFLQRKTLSFSIQKEKMNKRTKKYNYVKRENVAIATGLLKSIKTKNLLYFSMF